MQPDPQTDQQPARWTRQMFAHDAERIARRLLNSILVRQLQHNANTCTITARITETEAYLGPEDLASHARRGLRTPRNESMWQAPGTTYVYFTYGMHYCLNIATLRKHHPAAVLIRAVQPISNIAIIRERRQRASKAKASIRETQLTNGPAKLCKALDIDRRHDAIDMTTSSELWIERQPAVPPHQIEARPRIGLGKAAGTWQAKPLNFRCLPAST